MCKESRKEKNPPIGGFFVIKKIPIKGLAIWRPGCAQNAARVAMPVRQFGEFLVRMCACSLCQQQCCQTSARYIQFVLVR